MVNVSADGKTPFTSKKILQTWYHAIMTPGEYVDAYKEWQSKNLSYKTWTNFKSFFAQ